MSGKPRVGRVPFHGDSVAQYVRPPEDAALLERALEAADGVREVASRIVKHAQMMMNDPYYPPRGDEINLIRVVAEYDLARKDVPNE